MPNRWREMAQVDHLIATWITDHLLHLFFAALFLWIILKKGEDLKQRWFAFLMYQLSKEKDAKLEEVKKDLFSSLHSLQSHDPQLRNNKGIKILEIGVGTGVNLQHFPDGSHLVVVDPNPHFIKYFNDNRKKFPNISTEEIHVTTGEEMNVVADSSVDAVVVTLVMCSVVDTQKLLKQVLRVLVPGGKFYFMEHIMEFNPGKHWMRWQLQYYLTRSGVWPFLFEGCCLNRDMLAAIEGAGFSKVEGERFYAPITNFFFQIIKPHLKGIAVK